MVRTLKFDHRKTAQNIQPNKDERIEKNKKRSPNSFRLMECLDVLHEPIVSEIFCRCVTIFFRLLLFC